MAKPAQCLKFCAGFLLSNPHNEGEFTLVVIQGFSKISVVLLLASLPGLLLILECLVDTIEDWLQGFRNGSPYWTAES
jgi:hypothetical protein